MQSWRGAWHFQVSLPPSHVAAAPTYHHLSRRHNLPSPLSTTLSVASYRSCLNAGGDGQNVQPIDWNCALSFLAISLQTYSSPEIPPTSGLFFRSSLMTISCTARGSSVILVRQIS